MNSDYINKICSVYESYGYRQFRMSKFEEYDFYARNKDFLFSDKIITFNDTDGKLMALKPDVTLSIIKNSRNNSDMSGKVFYDENIYRVSKGTDTFREIRQVGIECFGNTDVYSVAEVLMLAAKTLQQISCRYVLAISDFSLVTDVLAECGITGDVTEKALKCIGNKNAHELRELLRSEDVREESIDLINSITGLYGDIDNIIPELRKILPDNDRIAEFEKIISLLNEFNIIIDFSLTGNIKYYNGIIFKGYISGIPEAVLSGGQYDRLLKKMKCSSGAMGFALYTDLTKELDGKADEYDSDIVIRYTSGCDVCMLNKIRDRFVNEGHKVFVCNSVPERFRYRKLYTFDGSEVKEVGSDA